jgi:hypothetical protein
MATRHHCPGLCHRRWVGTSNACRCILKFEITRRELERGVAIVVDDVRRNVRSSTIHRGAWLSALLLLSLLPISSPALSAQEVRGTAVEAGTARPIAGAFVSLVSRAGDATVSTLTGPGGAFVLEAPLPGRYTLEVERIGYQTWTSEPFDLVMRSTVTRRLEVTVLPVNLEGLTVAVESECGLRPGTGEPLLQAWEEVRKALDVSLWTEEPGRIQFELRTWTRMLDVAARVARSQESRSAWKTGSSSFVSPPAADLAANGYVLRSDEGNHLFFGPDARVFLSEAFRQDHCFQLVWGHEEHADLIGIQFDPIHRGEAARVEGVLWLDPSTGELRDLEFEFLDLNLVGLPREHRAWGRAWFRRLPPGIWVVSRWWIRTPVLRVSIRGTTLHGYREDGGEVTRLELGDGSSIDLTERGTLSGYAADGIAGGALVGAAVYLGGTGYVTTTDPAGRFRFDLVPEGRYTLRFRHPNPHLGEMEGPSQEVQVVGGEPTSLRLEFGSEWAVEKLCGGESPRAGDDVAGPTALLGRVRQAENGAPVPEALIRLRAEGDGESTAIRADSTGAYLVCGLGSPGPLSLRAESTGRQSDAIWVVVPESGLIIQDLEIAEAGASGSARSRS